MNLFWAVFGHDTMYQVQRFNLRLGSHTKTKVWGTNERFLYSYSYFIFHEFIFYKNKFYKNKNSGPQNSPSLKTISLDYYRQWCVFSRTFVHSSYGSYTEWSSEIDHFQSHLKAFHNRAAPCCFPPLRRLPNVTRICCCCYCCCCCCRSAAEFSTKLRMGDAYHLKFFSLE